MKEEHLPILTICIPTYNRAKILRENLMGINEQLKAIDTNEVELIVSDNCSPDNTFDVVASMKELGLPIVYNRNEENIGADRNFLKCMHLARGKYVYLLGDDDFLEDNAIKRLLDVLRGKNYGLVYIDTRHELDGSVKEYQDRSEFIKKVSYFYTFMSGCIFRSAAINRVEREDRYIATCLLQMPFYLQSTLMFDTNAVITFPVIKQVGADASNNGGYNYFEVFVKNYLTILGEYIEDKKLFSWLKKDIWHFVWMYTRRLLIDKIVGNFKTDNGWKILFKYYGNEWYFWWTLFKYPFGTVKRKIMKML